MLPWLRTVIRDAQAHHELHVVLDDEERLAGPVELPDPVGEVPDQRRVDAAGRLVEQQDRRVGDQQRRQLEQLALTVGQVAGRLVRQPGDPDELEQLQSRGASPLRNRRDASRRAASPRLRWVATSMFSSTVRRAKIRVSWNVRPIPSPNTRSGDAFVISLPSKRTSPCWMRS